VRERGIASAQEAASRFSPVVWLLLVAFGHPDNELSGLPELCKSGDRHRPPLQTEAEALPKFWL
jgi:hypothetical protein